jgi:hypothetical protein
MSRLKSISKSLNNVDTLLRFATKPSFDCKSLNFKKVLKLALYNECIVSNVTRICKNSFVINLRLAVVNFLSTKDSLVYCCFHFFQFFKADDKTNGPGKFLYWYCDQTLKDLLVFAQPGVPRPMFYQELISYPNQVAQFKWSCKCVYRNREVRLHADHSGTVQDLVTILNFWFILNSNVFRLRTSFILPNSICH